MLRTLNEFQKCEINATDGDIGQVKDVYFDDQDWVVRYVIVHTGSWLLGRRVLISPISMQKPDWPAHSLRVAITKEQVRKSPDIDTDQPVTRQHETQYLGYYGYPAYWVGGGMSGGGMLPMAMNPGFLAAPVPAAGQDQAAAERAQAVRASHRDDDPHLRSCKAVIGYHIHATDGEVGHVDELLIDDETWAVRYFVVKTSNWWVGHKVLIAPQWITGVHWTEQSVTVELTREAVMRAPPYDPDLVLNRPLETSLYTHYGHAPYWSAGQANSPVHTGHGS